MPSSHESDPADPVAVAAASGATGEALSRDDALARLAEAEDTLRAIAAGEVDAFVMSERGAERQVFSLSTADRPYRMFVENMRDGAATLSQDGLILYANERLASLLSRPRESVVGSPLTSFVAGGAPIGMQQLRALDGVGATVEFDLRDSHGAAVPVLVGFSPLDVDGERLICLTFTDLSAQKAQEREIARLSLEQADRLRDLQAAQRALLRQATHDTLTGLPNRTLLVDRIDRALAASKRSGRCTAVYFLDLDRFKHINDTQGHAAGDVVLCRVAEQLVAVLRPMDTVSRIGGDEFVVLAPEVDSHLHAVDIGHRLVAELCRRPDRSEDGERVAVSVGLSVATGGASTAEQLLKEADTAMYRAKSLGGARADVFDEALAQQVQERSSAHEMLQSALDDRRVVAYYQPIIDLAAGDVAGFEALARITAADGSILPPSAFIPIAEDTGLVVPLGHQVLELACGQAGRWGVERAAPARPLSVAVNLSARQFEGGDLAALVQAALVQGALDPASLHLELTETAILGLHRNIVDQLSRLREMGVEIGLDDFGTGYASLTHLRRLPLTFVKIDQTFVQGLDTLEDGRIVSAVVDLAANLGLRSIAEGVETPDQLARLRELGCDQAQGYLFARPVPPSQVSAAMLETAW